MVVDRAREGWRAYRLQDSRRWRMAKDSERGAADNGKKGYAGVSPVGLSK
jgi:hypothetical protein